MALNRCRYRLTDLKEVDLKLVLEAEELEPLPKMFQLGHLENEELGGVQLTCSIHMYMSGCWTHKVRTGMISSI